VTPSSVVGGAAAQGTITLSSPAPAGGALVTLTSDRAQASTPSSVTVLSGQTAATFPVTTFPVLGEMTAILTAAFNGASARGTITVTGSRIDGGETSTRSAPGGKRVGGSIILGVPIRAIRPLGGQDGGPPPQSAPTLFERQYTFYTPELNLLSETAPTSSTTATPSIAYDYVWFGGQPLAQIENATGTIAWYFNDHLGTPIRQTDNSGHLLWHAEYEPYGTIYAIRRGEARHQPLRLPGQTAEEGSDLYQNMFRFYRAGWGRYTQVDPIGLTPSLNLYGYVNGNPTRFADPQGLMRVDSSCLDCPCKNKMMKAVSDFNRYFTPGWGDRNPACRER
jgi:RHS repeat-associated protein